MQNKPKESENPQGNYEHQTQEKYESFLKTEKH